MLDSTRRAAARAFVGQTLTKNKAWSTLSYAYDYTTEGGMEFLYWYEDNPKKPQAQRLTEAVQAYAARVGGQPNLILVNEADKGLVYAGCEVRAEKRIGLNTYHVGRQD